MDKDVSEVEIRKRLAAGFGGFIALVVGIYAVLFATVVPVIMDPDDYAHPALAELTAIALVSALAWPLFAAVVYCAGRTIARPVRAVFGGAVITVFTASWAQMWVGLEGGLQAVIGLAGLGLLAWFLIVFVRMGPREEEPA